MPRRLTPPLALLTAFAFLSACTTQSTDGPPTVATRPSEASTSTSTSTTQSVPSSTSSASSTPSLNIPANARSQDAAGAEAFTKFYVDELNAAMRTADDTLLPMLSENSCRSCSSYNKIISDMKSREQHYEGNWVTIQSSAVTTVQLPTIQVQATIQQSGRTVDRNGALVDSPPQSSGKLVFTVKAADPWLMSEVQVVQ